MRSRQRPSPGSKILRYVRLFFGALVLLVLVVFLLSNHAATPVSFWPFGTVGSAVLGAIVLIAFGFGVLVGLLIQVPYRLRAHRRAKRAERELANLQKAPAKPETQAAAQIERGTPELPGLPPIA